MRQNRRKRVIFIWENFGPSHVDRCEALARSVEGQWEVIGIELAATSAVYEWKSEAGRDFHKETLFKDRVIDEVSFVRRFCATLRACVEYWGDAYFLCHYEHAATLALAIVLRCLGRRVFVMNDSKFDDRERSLGRECVKRLFYWPYHGGLASGQRSRDYMRLLGVPERKIALHYDAVSYDRVRRMAGQPMAPDGASFNERHFTIVARFVAKKNLEMALEAYAIYKAHAVRPRPLHLCGSGPLEATLRRRVIELGLADDVIFHGFVQTDEVCRILAGTLALILPSTEEQFGLVIAEAQALNIPVIVSENCGARDMLVRSGVNGFVIEPDNPGGLAFFMASLANDEALWRRMCLAAPNFSHLGDVAEFVRSVTQLIAKVDERRQTGTSS